MMPNLLINNIKLSQEDHVHEMYQRTLDDQVSIDKSVTVMAYAHCEVGQGRWRATFMTVSLLLILHALDVLTTHFGLQFGALEANPIMAGLISGVGEAATYIIKLSVVLVAAVLLCKMRSSLALKGLNLVIAVIVVSNFAVLSHSLIG